ncbi:MAG: response regulator [Candidatus Rokubacteria bacterium]|nr:response regulator [Candidatus Rokubacteria bacterium]
MSMREIQRDLTQAQKLELVGLLAGGIAHDFNNLLAIVLGHTGLLLNEPLSARQLKRVEAIHHAGERATGLTRRLLLFSRRDVRQPHVFDLNALIVDLMKMLRRLIREDIDLVTRLSGEPAKIMADPGQIEQVIINLAINARDAMAGAGVVTIETAVVDGAGGPGDPDTPGARSVVLTISDSGPGMTEDVKAHLFEAFFTTKAPGEGTGLGLVTAQGIIRQSGGEITCESELGRGATFTISLPQPVDEVAPMADPWVYSDLPRGTETILLVEDDGDVREIAGEILTQQGYRVLSARGGDAALQLLERHPGPIHLMLTDVVMPDMSGRKLAEQACGLRTEMQVVYISGHTDDVVLHAGVLGFLRKPFTPLGLARKVRETLDLR